MQPARFPKPDATLIQRFGSRARLSKVKESDSSERRGSQRRKERGKAREEEGSLAVRAGAEVRTSFNKSRTRTERASERRDASARGCDRAEIRRVRKKKKRKKGGKRTREQRNDGAAASFAKREMIVSQAQSFRTLSSTARLAGARICVATRRRRCTRARARATEISKFSHKTTDHDY